MAEEDEHLPEDEEKLKRKKKEAGIIYLSTIPPTMNVKIIREIFSKYGEIGRIFLQPDAKASKRSMNYFTEGWVEFKSKKTAKKVAECLNNSQVGGKRRRKYYDSLWNIKYLHRFRWIHLNERLAYEKAVRQQRMRAEVAQVKKETDHYVKSVEKSKRLARLETKIKKQGKEWKDAREVQVRQMSVQQDVTDQSDNDAIDKTLLANIFAR